MPKATIRVLRVLTPLTALVSVVTQAIAICTNRWLHSEEMIANTKYNGSGGVEYFTKYTISGLWEMCCNDHSLLSIHMRRTCTGNRSIYVGSTELRCFNIDYFPREEYSPDPMDSTMAIPYAAKKASVYVFISAIVLIIGVILCLFGHCMKRRKVFMFASGVAFILSGLMVLVGMVMYISTFKSEVGHKLRPKSSFQGPLFIYRYGFSFILAVTSLMTCELSGTFAIFLCIHRYQEDWKKKSDRQKFADYIPSGGNGVGVGASSAEDQVPCRRHQRGRRNSRSRDGNNSRESSPCPSTSRGGRRGTSATLPLSESMRDLAFYNFPPFSRDTTCNTVSTSADINREYSRDFSFETLRRTTPV